MVAIQKIQNIQVSPAFEIIVGYVELSKISEYLQP
jgi:hypothetical protein